MTRIYIDSALLEGEEVTLPADSAHHVRSVLRLAVDAELTLFNDSGVAYAARLSGLRRDSATVTVLNRLADNSESPLQVTLVQSISRGERMDYTLQKAVELGVTRIVPVTSTRTVVKLDRRRAEKRMAHWRGVVQHAAEQSGRCRLPRIDEVLTLADWSDAELAAPKAPPCFVLHPHEARALARMDRPDKSLVIIAGPEGGFDTREITRLLDAGAHKVSLGPRILRTETAAVCALSVCQALWGDLA